MIYTLLSVRIFRPALVFFLMLCCVFSLFALPGDTTGWIPAGKVYGKIFSNFHAGLNSNNNSTGFEISRAYFGYRSSLGNGFEADIKLDIGSPEDVSQYSLIRRYAYFKNAYVKYSHAKLQAYFGIIDLLHFKDQEKYWGHRYIEKSFADRYRFGNSADLGTQVRYKWSERVSADLTFMNGEGYSKLQTDNTFKAGAGFSVHPVKILLLRVYADASVKNSVSQTAMVFFAGAKITDKAVAGVEFNNELNSGHDKGYDRFGYSLFCSYWFTKKWQVFGRYDKVFSNKPDGAENPWNLSKDGSSIIGGLEFSPVKNVKFALNYQDWFPYAQNEPNIQFLFLNAEVDF